MRKFVIFLLLFSLLFSSLTTYEYYSNYKIYQENGHYTFLEFTSDIINQEQKQEIIPFPLLIFLEGLILFVGIPLIVEKIYKNIYKSDIPKKYLVFSFIFLMTSFGIGISGGFYTQIPSILLALLFLYSMLEKNWKTSIILAILTNFSHSTGIIMIGIMISTILIKNKKYFLTIGSMFLSTLIPSATLFNIHRYNYSLINKFNNNIQDWKLYFFGQIRGLIQIAYLRYENLILAFLYMIQTFISFTITIYIGLKFSEKRPIFVNYLMGILFIPFIVSLFTNSSLSRIGILFFALFPLLIPEQNLNKI